MPSYDYICDDCGYEFEVIQKITEEPLKVCPKCKKKTVRRLLSASPFILKGQGWYVTDYGRKGTKEGSAGEKDNKRGGKGESKIEGKEGKEDKKDDKEKKEPKSLPANSTSNP